MKLLFKLGNGKVVHRFSLSEEPPLKAVYKTGQTEITLYHQGTTEDGVAVYRRRRAKKPARGPSSIS